MIKFFTGFFDFRERTDKVQIGKRIDVGVFLSIVGDLALGDRDQRTARAHRLFDGGQQVSRRLKAKSDRIANVQIVDFLSGGLHFLRLGHDVPDGVGEAVRPRGCRDWCVDFGRGHARNFTPRGVV